MYNLQAVELLFVVFTSTTITTTAIAVEVEATTALYIICLSCTGKDLRLRRMHL